MHTVLLVALELGLVWYPGYRVGLWVGRVEALGDDGSD